MKQRQKIVLFLVLLMASSCFAYEVVLKNGKILTGEVVSDNHELMILRDPSGVRLQIRKNQIDSIKTEERNKKTSTVAAQPKETEIVAPEKASVEKPKTKARVYKKEDLEKMPELTVIGKEESPDGAAVTKELRDRAEREKEEEAAWNEEALRLDDQIQQAREAYEYNQSFCDKVIPDVADLRDGAYVILSAEQYEEQRRVACMEAEAAAKDLKRHEAEFEEFLEDARKQGIPPGWVDPERLRN
jgi:hypothetical protein